MRLTWVFTSTKISLSVLRTVFLLLQSLRAEPGFQSRSLSIRCPSPRCNSCPFPFSSLLHAEKSLPRPHSRVGAASTEPSNVPRGPGQGSQPSGERSAPAANHSPRRTLPALILRCAHDLLSSECLLLPGHFDPTAFPPKKTTASWGP